MITNSVSIKTNTYNEIFLASILLHNIPQKHTYNFFILNYFKGLKTFSSYKRHLKMDSLSR